MKLLTASLIVLPGNRLLITRRTNKLNSKTKMSLLQIIILKLLILQISDKNISQIIINQIMQILIQQLLQPQTQDNHNSSQIIQSSKMLKMIIRIITIRNPHP